MLSKAASSVHGYCFSVDGQRCDDQTRKNEDGSPITAYLVVPRT